MGIMEGEGAAFSRSPRRFGPHAGHEAVVRTHFWVSGCQGLWTILTPHYPVPDPRGCREDTFLGVWVSGVVDNFNSALSCPGPPWLSRGHIFGCLGVRGCGQF